MPKTLQQHRTRNRELITKPPKMSTISALQCSFALNSHGPPSSSSRPPIRNLHLHRRTHSVASFNGSTLTAKTKQCRGTRKLRSSEEETLIPEPDEQDQPPIAVPVSPSDKLLMIFQAEGVMTDSVVPKVRKALEEMEDILDLQVNMFEGLGTVELVKQTSAQATGVASSLVETIQGLGFKLQTLNLSFEENLSLEENPSFEEDLSVEEDKEPALV